VSVAERVNGGRPLVVLVGAPLPPPYGGIARYMQLVVPALLFRGFRVRIMQPDQPMRPLPLSGLPDDADLESAIFEYPGARRLAAWLLRRPALLRTLLSSYAGALLRRPVFALRQLGITACSIRSAEQLIRGERPAIVHAFDWPWSYGMAAVAVARRHGGRSMLSFFGDVLPHREELEQFDSVSRAFVTPSRRALQSADLIASMTDHCRELVRHAGLSPDDVELVRVAGTMESFHPGVDGSAIRGRYADHDGPLLLFVGQLRPRKGPRVLIEALPTIRERQPHARAILVGPDHDHVAELRELAESLHLVNPVDFVGTVSDEELPSYYAAADVFVFPTVTTIECLGLTFVQAMFAGTPVVATRIAGAPEVIQDGEHGFLVEPGNAEALAERVLHVLELPPNAREAVRRQARERAAELYNESAILQDLFKAYDRLL
jgi:glycosyltransferase involved in cell wall biosynthesis